MTSSRVLIGSIHRRMFAIAVVLALVATITLVGTPEVNADRGGAPTNTTASVALTHVAAGGESTCVINTSDQVFCLGEIAPRERGELASPLPVEISGFSGVPEAISTAEDYACVIVAGGDIQCWGYYEYLELQDEPTTVPSFTRPATALAVGGDALCALVDDGSLQCLGFSPDPSAIVTFDGPFVGVATGDQNVCGVTADGAIYCADYDADLTLRPQFGLPKTAVAIDGRDDVTTCSLDTAGDVWCQKRDGDVELALSGATSVSVGNDHACASLVSREVQCWFTDTGNRGQLGEAFEDANGAPVTIAGISNAVAVSAGYDHNCAVLGSGEVQCWGDNSRGQTSDPADSSSPVPVRSFVGFEVDSMAAGDAHTCFSGLDQQSRAFCFGAEAAAARPRIPTQMLFRTDTKVTSLHARANQTCGILDAYEITCWGSADGPISLRADLPSTSPEQIYASGDNAPVPQITIGGRHACLRRASGHNPVVCFGENNDGQITGTPSAEVTSGLPEPLGGSLRLIGTHLDVHAGSTSTCTRIRLNAGAQPVTIYCWGNPADGRLGKALPNTGGRVGEVLLASEPTSLAVGSAHGCAAREDQRVACWGQNSSGQLGKGDTNEVVPTGGTVLIQDLTGVTKVFAGLFHTCAIHNEATQISCWGEGDEGQLGDGNMTNSPSPVLVQTPEGQTWETMALGYEHSCARTTEGDAWCWGEGNDGQLANQDIAWSPRTLPGITVSTEVVVLECNGLAVTIEAVAGVPTVGTAGDDVVLGTEGPDEISTGDGNDVVCGLDGHDTIATGGGDDLVIAGDGDDFVLGGFGNDELIGGPGNDRLFGRQGNDTITGDDGDDTIHGNIGEDDLSGGAGDDRIFGYANDDVIRGGPGHDRLHGNFGDDMIIGGEGDDRIFGYGDQDTLFGDTGDDLITGNFGDDTIHGGPGNDTLFGADGDDIVNGDAGNDLVNGNSLNDTLDGGIGNDTLDGGIDVDTCNGNAGTDTATRCETTTNVP